ncbi:MAG: hypothetical protein WDO68_21945 [Gammaproteobacteria bacterium]
MSESTWQLLVTVFDTVSAQLISDRLNGEGVPTQVLSESAIFGAARSCQVLVPTQLLGRARKVLSSEQLSDSELSYLATGKLGTDRTG